MIGDEPNGVVAVFATTERANAALETLKDAKIDMRTVSVLGPGHEGERVPAELDHSPEHGREVALFWASWGAVVGSATGGAVIAVPLIAAIVGLGPFAPVLAAVLVGATGVGSLASALIGYGVHEAHARAYDAALHAGKTIIVVHSDELEQLEVAKACLSENSPERVDTHGMRRLGGV